MHFFMKGIYFPVLLSLASSVLAADELLEFDKVGKYQLPRDTSKLFEKYPIYKKKATAFASKAKKRVEMSGSLYVMQREMAVTGPDDQSVRILGSDDASTCIIAILRHTGSKATGLASFDHSRSIKNGVNDLVKRVKALTSWWAKGRYELSLMVGVKHEYTEIIFRQLLPSFHDWKLPMTLVLANIGEVNTEYRDEVAFPIIYGAGVDVQSGEIFPTDSFDFKGPERVLRGVRLLTGEQKVISIYSNKDRQVKIMPRDFKYKAMLDVDTYIQMDDTNLLKAFSSTPKTELPLFVKEVKEELQFLKDHPDWRTVIAHPIIYYRVNGKGAWVKKDVPKKRFSCF